MNVTLISYTQPTEAFLKKNNVEVASAEQILIYVARVTSSRENKLEDYVGLLNYLMRNSHWSPFEHAYFTFEIETSRAIGRQLLRHRSFTFQEFSQRYSEATEMESIEFRKQAENNRQSSTERLASLLYKDNEFIYSYLVNGEVDNDFSKLTALMNAKRALSDIQEAYKALVDNGFSRETARFILPETTQTTIHMTGNLRSWIHFLQIREDEHAQKEIRKIAKEIKSQLIPYAENTIKAYNKYLKQ